MDTENNLTPEQLQAVNAGAYSVVYSDGYWCIADESGAILPGWRFDDASVAYEYASTNLGRD